MGIRDTARNDVPAGSRRRWPALATAVIGSVAALMPATAGAANWIEPIIIDSGDVRMVGSANGHGHPHAATGPDGTTTLVWGRPGPPLVGGAPTRTITMARIDPSGTTAPQVALSPAVEEGYDPRVVLGPGGAGVVLWHRFDGFADFRIFLRRIDAAGVPGPRITICEGLCYGAEAAVAGDGSVLVAWHTGGGAPAVRRLGADGTLGPVRTVPTTGNGSAFLVPLALAPAPDGSALLAYVTQTPGQRVEATRIAPDGTPGPVHMLSDIGLAEETALDAPDAYVTPDGTGHVAFRAGTRAGPFTTDPLDVTLRAARIDPGGGLRDVRTLTPVGNAGQPFLVSQGSPPSIVPRPGGGLAVAFLQHGPGEACAIALVALSPAGTPAPPTVGGTPESCESTQPDFASGRADGSTVAVSTGAVLGNTDIGIPLTFRVEASSIGVDGTPAGREVLSTGFGLNARTSAGGDVVAAYWYTGREGAGSVGISLYSDRFPPRPVQGPGAPAPTAPPGAGTPGGGAPAEGAPGGVPKGLSATPAPRLATAIVRSRGRLLLRITGRLPVALRGRTLLIQRRRGARFVTLARRRVPPDRRIAAAVRLFPGRVTGAAGVRGLSALRVRVVVAATPTRRAGIGPVRVLRLVTPAR